MTIKYYHISRLNNKESILEKGLIAQIGENIKTIGDEKGVYLFTSFENMEDGLSNWMDDIFDEDDELAIFEVSLPDNFELFKTLNDWEVMSTVDIPPQYITCIEE